MTSIDALPAHSHDPRLAPLLLAATPAWLWTIDVTRVVWADAAGAALLDASSPAYLSERRFDRGHATAGDLARLVGGLRSDGPSQFARLRGLAPGVGRVLLCACSRLRLGDGTACILVVAGEPTKPVLPLRERIRRMLGDAPDALAFAADGTLLHAGAAAAMRLAGRDTLEALGADALAAQALASGTADGPVVAGAMRLDRIGTGDAVALLAVWEESAVAPAEPPAIKTAQPEAVEPAANERAQPEPSEPVASESALSEASEPAASEHAQLEASQPVATKHGEPETTEPFASEHAEPETAESVASAEPEAAGPAANERAQLEASEPVASEPLTTVETSAEVSTPTAVDAADQHADASEPAPESTDRASAPAVVDEAAADDAASPALSDPTEHGQAGDERDGDEAAIGEPTTEPAESPEEISAPAATIDPPQIVDATEAIDTSEPVDAPGPVDAPEAVDVPEAVDASPPEQTEPAGEPPPAIPIAPAHPAHEEALAALDEAEARLVERHHPLRFVWTIDADGRFAIERGEFTALTGGPTAAVQDRPWDEVAAKLGLDPHGRVARAVASHDTWSGITVAWPIQDTAHRLPILMSGLPALGRDRSFRGYRGFGVCREIDRIAAVITARRARLLSNEPEQPVAPAEFDEPPVDDTPEPDQPSVGENNGAFRSNGTTFSEERLPETLPPEAARPQLTVVPPAKNVVPFRGGMPAERRATLSSVERNAFQEIARALGARLETDTEAAAAERPEGEPAAAPAATPAEDVPRATQADVATPEPGQAEEAAAAPSAAEVTTGEPIAEVAADSVPPAAATLSALPARPPARSPSGPLLERRVLDRLPIGVIVYRPGEVLLANRALLEWTGLESLDALTAAGGLDALFDDSVTLAPEPDGVVHTVALRSAAASIPVNAHLCAIGFEGGTALMLTLARIVSDARQDQSRVALDAAEATIGELRSILDTATDGVILVDEDGLVLAANRSAEALFGYESHELTRRSFVDLFAPESQGMAADYLEGLTRSGVASLLNDGREVIGQVRQGGLIPLFMTMGRIADTPPKFCMVLRDITQWKRAEEELTNAKRQAEKASSAKSDFLAKISHEIRTPLNAIIGFSEVMMEQRFGPIGNERYRDYLRDIHTSGEHMISLLNDLLDLSKIEAGKLDLTFAKVDLNDVMQQCVAIMQPQANRERIIIRTALSSTLPPVVADARSMRQIVLNLLSNSIKFTGAGGQVIVSTALTDAGEAVMRVRDTGVGMSDKDITTALEPFRQLPTSARPGTVGTGLGLPLTKALAEANRAAFHIKSAVNSGTLVEIVFPPTRVLAE